MTNRSSQKSAFGFKLATAATVCAVASLTLVQAADAASGRMRARGPNGTAVAAAGNGQVVVRGRGAQTNDDGSVTTASGGAYANRSGTRAARASTTTVNPDGSAERQSGLNASGAKGSVTSTGEASRTADGNGSGTRTTSATSTATGNSYNGQTTYSRDTGVSRTATCTDAAGTVIACPRQ